ncbi:hypothetical protein [Bradyrhizobium sp. USDA 3315]
MATDDLERGLQKLASDCLKKEEPFTAFKTFRKRAIARFGDAARPLLDRTFARAQRDALKGSARYPSPTRKPKGSG